MSNASSPPRELLRAVAVLAEPPTPEHERIAELIGVDSVPTASDYSDLFLFQLYPYASVHLGPEGMMGGEVRERVAGFWSAVGQRPPAEPDHLAALLGLYAALCDQEEGADGADAVLIRQSRGALLHEHLAGWVFAFLERVRELTSGSYKEWARLLTQLLRAEAAAFPADGRALPVHLQLAPPLPDPRAGDTASFLSALLAPARCGMIVTRADLASLASRTELGLRAGERRYALEHLMAQDPVATLSALAEEAARQGQLHAAREPWLGEVSSFLANRARATASLLVALANDGETHLAEQRAPIATDV